MRPGDKYLMVVRPEFAYGADGRGKVDPDTTLGEFLVPPACLWEGRSTHIRQRGTELACGKRGAHFLRSVALSLLPPAAFTPAGHCRAMMRFCTWCSLFYSASNKGCAAAAAAAAVFEITLITFESGTPEAPVF